MPYAFIHRREKICLAELNSMMWQAILCITLLLHLCIRIDGLRFPVSRLSHGRSERDRFPRHRLQQNDHHQKDNVLQKIEKKWLSISPDTRGDFKSASISFALALFVRLFIIEPRFIPSLSMYPTFDVGDQLLVDKISSITRSYKRRDVVVFNPPETYVIMTGNTEALIKRIVAVAGDTVEVKGRHLYVNGVMQVENYINDDPDYDLPLTTVPEGTVLVLGDNRNRSFDSHVWGFLPERNIIGRAVVKYWPPQRIGFVEGST